MRSVSAAALSPCIPLLAAAFALAEGMQLLRSALAGLSVYLGQVRDVDPPLLGALIFAVFLAAFAAPLVCRLLGVRRAFLVLAGVLALLRLAEQFATQVDVRLVLALAGVVVWLWLVPLVVVGAYGTARGGWRAAPVVVVLVGLLLDTALKGAFGTLDLGFAWGLAAQVTTVALTLAQLGLLFSLAETSAKPHIPSFLRRQESRSTQVRSHSRTWPYPKSPIARNPATSGIADAPPVSSYALGPALALHLLIFQNIAQYTVLTGWSLPAVFAWTLAANLVALWVALALTRRGSLLPRWSLLVAAGVAIASVVPGLPAVLVVVGAMAGPVAIAVLLASGLGVAEGGRRGWVAVGLGLLIIPVVLFGWYAHYEIAVPVPQWAIVVAAAVLAGAGGVGPSSAPPGHPLPSLGQAPPQSGVRGEAGALLAGLLLMFLPLYQFVSWDLPRPPPADLYPLRVITYNIHQGFDLEGRPALEQIARTIEAQEAQIVGLQEVPRGWLVNGGVDALSWLGQRLEMHTAWGPAADPFWGNAILSRYPIVSVENRPMPNNDALTFDRAFLTVEIDAPGESIQVVITHLHHIEREPQHRLPQVQALVDRIDWSRPTILLGDLNAQPHHRELRILTRSGLVMGERPLPTFPADRPRRQIDYVLTTDHFEIAETWAVSTTASDHLPLLAVLVPRDARGR